LIVLATIGAIALVLSMLAGLAIFLFVQFARECERTRPRVPNDPKRELYRAIYKGAK